MKKLFAALAIVLSASTAQAHFPWLMVDEEGKASYFFGENVAEKTYKLPPGIAKAEVFMRADGKTLPVETKPIESQDFVGKRSITSVPANADLISQATFGVYHGAKLQYYTQYMGGTMPTKFSDCSPIEKMDLQAHAVHTDGGVDVYVLWKDNPLTGTEVHLFCEEGHEEGSAKTDANGKVSFSDTQVEDGINGIMVGNTVSDETGKIGDQEYKSAMHYLTAIFKDPED
tara:strand:- start:485 stop:1171 length:687 start_codon:yes stop_codon:yes gene_type:complete